MGVSRLKGSRGLRFMLKVIIAPHCNPYAVLLA